jgi:hypothetical protein
MITPILQRARDANPGDPIREPEITSRDLVGVRDGALRRTWRSRTESELRKGACGPFCSIRDREIVAGSALYKRLRFSPKRFVKFPRLFLIGGNQSEPECLNKTGKARQPPTGWNEHERRPSIRRHDR